jgi:formylglycine-generating enzyme
MQKLGQLLFVGLWASGCATLAGIDEFKDQGSGSGSAASGSTSSSGGAGTSTGGANSSSGGSNGSQSGGTDTASGGTDTTSGGSSSSGGTGSSSGGTAASSGSDAGGGGGDSPEPIVLPSCEDLPAACGDDGNDDCCAHPLVDGNEFFRDYDGVISTDDSFPATVSDFHLDRYEIVVGRFRSFVAAWIDGWRPAAGNGKHTHLNEGSGLAGKDGAFEPGWDASWNIQLATSNVDWDTNLACDPTNATWTSAAGDNESEPINCITWWEATAFCIWDGGFLPSETEWNYAAAGGPEQRYYPWSDPPASVGIDCDHVNYSTSFPGDSCIGSTSAAGAYSPDGDGLYGHSDLAGNLWEWTLDWDSNSYLDPCLDCARSAPDTMSPQRQIRGGGFNNGATAVRVTVRAASPPSTRDDTIGARCARP